MVQFELELSLSCTHNNASDILIGGIISQLVAGDKLPSQRQPYCSFNRIVVQEIRLVQTVKLLQFAACFQIVICMKIL